MSTLDQTVAFEGHRVRILGTPEHPAFVAKDVCHVLGIHNSRTTLAAVVPAEEKGVHSVDTLGGPQEVATVTQGGLWRLVARSKKPSAARFQTWLFNDVVPCILRHGRYPAPSAIVPAAQSAPPSTLGLARQMLEALEAQERQIAEQGARIARIEARAEVAEADLRALPPAPVDAPVKSLRAQVNERVRAWGSANGGAYQPAWSKLKHELLYRCHFDAVIRAAHNGHGWLDEVETAGLMPQLYAIACDVLP